MNDQRNELAHGQIARSNVELTGRRRRSALAARRNMYLRRLAARVLCRWRSG